MRVLVAGPAGAGVSSLAAALRDRIAGVVEVAAGPPDAVVFAVSAIAPLTESDGVLFDGVAERTDNVVAVVTKIDIHHRWRNVMAADREILARRADRYARLPWLGVAAAPESGAARIDELVELLSRWLADPRTPQRNRWRVEEAAAGREVAGLRRRREALRRDARLARAQGTLALRGGVQQARVELLHAVRTRCTAVHTELADEIAGLGRRDFPPFEDRVRIRAAQVCADTGAEVAARLAEVAAGLHLPAPPGSDPPATPPLPGPPWHRRRLESRLMVLLGTGFGLGVALGVSRLLAGLDPRLGFAGMAAGGLAGLMVTASVVGIRGLLADRLVLDRWVTEVIAAVRSAAEETVASRVVTAEAELTRDLVAAQETAAARTAEHVADIDARLRNHVRAAAAATFAGREQTVTDQ